MCYERNSGQKQNYTITYYLPWLLKGITTLEKPRRSMIQVDRHSWAWWEKDDLSFRAIKCIFIPWHLIYLICLSCRPLSTRCLKTERPHHHLCRVSCQTEHNECHYESFTPGHELWSLVYNRVCWVLVTEVRLMLCLSNRNDKANIANWSILWMMNACILLKTWKRVWFTVINSTESHICGHFICLSL